MAWWNGPVLIIVAAIIPAILSLIFKDWWISVISTLVGALYYGAYEYTHWCMHLPRPKKRLMERMHIVGWVFYRLNGHHLLHHRYMGRNFNVVLPFWDLCFGTLLLRSSKPFIQARGPCVPDVQPKAQSPFSAG